MQKKSAPLVPWPLYHYLSKLERGGGGAGGGVAYKDRAPPPPVHKTFFPELLKSWRCRWWEEESSGWRSAQWGLLPNAVPQALCSHAATRSNTRRRVCGLRSEPQVKGSRRATHGARVSTVKPNPRSRRGVAEGLEGNSALEAGNPRALYQLKTCSCTRSSAQGCTVIAVHVCRPPGVSAVSCSTGVVSVTFHEYPSVSHTGSAASVPSLEGCIADEGWGRGRQLPMEIICMLHCIACAGSVFIAGWDGLCLGTLGIKESKTRLTRCSHQLVCGRD